MAIDFTKDVLLTRRESDMPSGTIIPPGVGFGKCDGCGERVILSDESRKIVETGVQLVCNRCVPDGSLDGHLLDVTLGQLEEAERIEREIYNN